MEVEGSRGAGLAVEEAEVRGGVGVGLGPAVGMPDWTKLFGGIINAIKSLEATVKVQNQRLHHQNLILEDLIHLKAEEIYGEDLLEGLKGVLDVEPEEVMGLVDERREAE